MRQIWFIAIFFLFSHSLITQSVFAQEDGDDKPSIPLDHFYAKPKNQGLRSFLNRLNFSFSPGYGRTFYRQDLGDFAILQRDGEDPIIFSKDLNTTGGTISSSYGYWFNDVIPADSGQSFSPANDFLVSSDTADLTYRGRSFSIPLTATIHVEFDRYKIGAGFVFEYHNPGEFRPTSFEDRLGTYDANFGSTFFKKYFLFLGAKVYRYNDYVLAVDAQIGAFNLSKKFNNSVIQKGVYFNLGTTIEREMSEYFSLFVRPSYDFKNYTVELPETDLAVNTGMNAFFVSIGFTYRIPELKKCFLKNCTTQINHQHGDRKYRSRMHPIWKWQDPHHGQNYPSLIKYKGKNKKKMHPY